MLCIQKGAIALMSLHIAASDISKGQNWCDVFKKVQYIVASDILQLMLYKTTIRPVLDYGAIIYDPCLKSESEAIETFQRKAALVCTGAFRISSNVPLS